ncbi:hypothetical protein [Chitinophaga sp. Cy-1792]|uniref:hypothetical protein n=1 Tax=Chitinophaga sp. Cy-1792 TaxID=2608339 RepID=UPI00141FDAD6|nr:hypothetical protein [Chitinophaga sp. Cy-1792]NIG54412.1 hypothetical protein [Chitinophaga sp. Cy-1792]
MLNRCLFFFVTVILSAGNSNGQAVYTKITQVGKVVYSSGIHSSRDSIKLDLAMLCSKYIFTYYKHKKLPFIYLAVSPVKVSDTVTYEMSYDNIHGHALNNSNVKVRNKYMEPGIRIWVSDFSVDKRSLLKLLDFGINNLKDLKSLYRKAVHEEEYDDELLQLPQEKIFQILSQPATKEIEDLLAQ